MSRQIEGALSGGPFAASQPRGLSLLVSALTVMPEGA